jgi:S1-C subfamily serine protease
MSHRRVRNILLVLLLCLQGISLSAAGKTSASSHDAGPQVDERWPGGIGKMQFGPIGVTGIGTRIYGGDLTVEKIQPNTPADGKLKKGDIITGVNGATVKVRSPYVVLGRALTRVEATSGAMVFDVKSGK